MDLIQRIDQYYETRNEDKSLCPIRVSSFGDCPNKLLALARGSEREELSAKTYRIFEMGSSRGRDLGNAVFYAMCDDGVGDVTHEQEIWVELPVHSPVAIAVYERMKWQFGEVDLPIRPTLNGLAVRGRADVVIETKPGLLHIVEIKTKNSYGFDRLPEEGPGLQYMLQLYGYVLGLQQQGKTVASATFLFENKDNCELLAIPLDMAQAKLEFERWMSRFIGALTGLAASSDNAEPAPVVNAVRSMLDGGKVSGKLPWPCNYCSVGPVAGRCAEKASDTFGFKVDIVDKRRSGAEKPAYEVRRG